MTAYITDKLEPFELTIDGKDRIFDILDPQLPDWIGEEALSSANYPYEKKLKRNKYEERLFELQIELVKLQSWVKETGQRVVAIFEGRDAAGKGGTISAVRQFLNPRSARNVALSKPTETERGQWYFQRYVAQFPTSGEFVTFDRSWYNRAGVEPVMGFCTPEQHKTFLDDVPGFEKAIVDDGMYFFKFWLNIGRQMQLKRFHDRVHSPVKFWKFSPIDVAGILKWDDYTRHRDIMLDSTDTSHSPWVIVRSNDKRRARISVVREILAAIPYAGKDETIIGDRDDNIVATKEAVIRI